MKRAILPFIFLAFSILPSCRVTKPYHNNGINIQWNWFANKTQETGSKSYNPVTNIVKKSRILPDESISKLQNSSDELVLYRKELNVPNNYCITPAINFSGTPKQHAFFSKQHSTDTITGDSLYQAKIKRLKRKTKQNANAFLIFWLVGGLSNLGGEVVLIFYAIYVGLPVFMFLVPIIIITFLRYHYHKAKYKRLQNETRA